MIIPVKTSVGGYEIVIERGALSHIGDYADLSRKVLIVTDDGVPQEYAHTVADLCKEALTIVIPHGEQSKNFDNYKTILQALVGADFTRSDCIVAVGGGVVGDMAGFAAATYMRGIDFYNIPTTVLSEVDSSVGGKTAIDFAGYKNIVGSFYPPKKVIIDPDTLKTLDSRQISNGLCEVIKMAATSDEKLFSLLKSDTPLDFENIIARAVNIKKSVVEADEKEADLRRVLNFGHTVGHAVESSCPQLLHGECVGIGMLYMSSGSAREQIERVLKKYRLPTSAQVPFNEIAKAILHDKKAKGSKITTVFVDEIGKFRFITEETQKICERIEKEWDK